MANTSESSRSLLAKVATQFDTKPFIPHPVFKQADAQTIGAHFWPGRFRARDLTHDEERLFEVELGSRVLARCRWQINRAEHPTLVMWHGMEGSTASPYMLTTAHKAFRSGFNVIRVNVRNCGGTEHLTPTLYHGGMSEDVRVVIDELINRDRLSRILILGFSLGGNQVLKVAGEYGDDPPRELKGISAVSPSISLGASCDSLMRRRNWIYHREFLGRLKMRLRMKEKLFPEFYNPNGLRDIRTIRQFDEQYIAPAFGFANADDYYAKASSQGLIRHIRIPTLIIHAQDDPFVPFAPLRDPSIAANPYVLLLTPNRGGHVAFISANSHDEDRFWAENRVVEFCNLVDTATSTNHL